MKTKTLNYLGNKILLIIFLIPITYFVLFSSPCPGKTTITVQIAYGGVICGGVGLCLYSFYSFRSDVCSQDIMSAILNIRRGRISLGIPAIDCEQSVLGISLNPPAQSYYVKFLRWEF